MRYFAPVLSLPRNGGRWCNYLPNRNTGVPLRKSRKLILIAGALAALAVPSVASADVSRCQTPVTSTGPVPATFSVYHPREDLSQWQKTWQHDFNVMIDPTTGKFSGTGSEFNGQNPEAGSVA